jgi:hypothetical protein
MSRLEAIKEQIKSLSAGELAELLEWLLAYQLPKAAEDL